MQTLAFDARMGASGDMLLGALLDTGADRSALAPVEDALDVEYDVRRGSRCGISATDVTVVLPEERPDRGDTRDGDDHDDSHAEEHDHAETHDHTDQEHAGGEEHGQTRSYPEVVEIIESMGLPAPIEGRALEIVRVLGEAEASIHDTDLKSTHFHEVGADDAIADIVGVTLLLADLDPERVVTTPVAAGGGDVEMSHGVYPVPTPAVTEIATNADWSLRGGPLEAELLTPTGAAILAVIADGVDQLPTLVVERTGYGAGDRSFASHPNVLRVLAGTASGGLDRDPVTVLETNLDDATPEELGGLQETLADAGALDVSILPATMKKSRPGHLVKVVVKPEDAERVARRLAVETGTLGVREHGRGHRLIADRETERVTVDTDAGEAEIAVKIARLGEEVFDVSAEFDDAKAAAEGTGHSIREIMRRAEHIARERL